MFACTNYLFSKCLGYFDDNATWVLENHVFPTWAKQSQEESGEIHDESRTKELIQTLREK